MTYEQQLEARIEELKQHRELLIRQRDDALEEMAKAYGSLLNELRQSREIQSVLRQALTISANDSGGVEQCGKDVHNAYGVDVTTCTHPKGHEGKCGYDSVEAFQRPLSTKPETKEGAELPTRPIHDGEFKYEPKGGAACGSDPQSSKSERPASNAPAEVRPSGEAQEWRELGPDETVVDGDQWKFGKVDETWSCVTLVDIGRTVEDCAAFWNRNPPYLHYRRRVEPAKESSLPDDRSINDAAEVKQFPGDRAAWTWGAQWMRARAQALLDQQCEKVSAYATAARVINLHLKDFCDESLSYDKMIAEAARKASLRIDQEREEKERLREQLQAAEGFMDSAKDQNDCLKQDIDSLIEQRAKVSELHAAEIRKMDAKALAMIDALRLCESALFAGEPTWPITDEARAAVNRILHP